MNNAGYRTAFGLSTFTTAIGIATIYEYLGIVLTILGIVSAILSIMLSIRTWYKNANADGTYKLQVVITGGIPVFTWVVD